MEIKNWDKTKIDDSAKYGMKQLGIDLFIFVRFGNNIEIRNGRKCFGFCWCLLFSSN